MVGPRSDVNAGTPDANTSAPNASDAHAAGTMDPQSMDPQCFVYDVSLAFIRKP